MTGDQGALNESSPYLVPLIGLALSFAATRGLSIFLFGVSAFDPAVFGGVTAALVGAALIASLIPARRATRVDPLVALRND